MSDKGIKEKEFIEESLDQELSGERILVLYNDDYHTFDYVIEALIEVCNHKLEQAEQCTYIVHYKGKCDVKHGTYYELKPMMNGLRDRDLRVTIE